MQQQKRFQQIKDVVQIKVSRIVARDVAILGNAGTSSSAQTLATRVVVPVRASFILSHNQQREDVMLSTTTIIETLFFHLRSHL